MTLINLPGNILDSTSLSPWNEGPYLCTFVYLAGGVEQGNCSSVKLKLRASQVAQWLRICLPMRGTRVRALAREDPTCCGATKPVSHNYWAHVPQLLRPGRLEPVLRNKRGHNEKPVHCNEAQPPAPQLKARAQQRRPNTAKTNK